MIRYVTLGAVALMLAAAAPAQPADTTSVAGVVLDARGYAPLAGALVELLSPADSVVGRTTTRDDGAFALRVAPAGRYVLRVRRLGFTPFVSELPSGIRRDTLALALDPAPQLLERATVLADATPAGRMLQAMGFTDRRRMGIGRFIGPGEVAAKRPASWDELFGRRLPGCSMIFIDGVRLRGLRDIRVEDVVGVEMYASNAEAPPQYFNPAEGLARCGSVVVWTLPGHR